LFLKNISEVDQIRTSIKLKIKIDCWKEMKQALRSEKYSFEPRDLEKLMKMENAKITYSNPAKKK